MRYDTICLKVTDNQFSLRNLRRKSDVKELKEYCTKNSDCKLMIDRLIGKGSDEDRERSLLMGRNCEGANEV